MHEEKEVEDGIWRRSRCGGRRCRHAVSSPLLRPLLLLWPAIIADDDDEASATAPEPGAIMDPVPSVAFAQENVGLRDR